MCRAASPPKRITSTVADTQPWQHQHQHEQQEQSSNIRSCSRMIKIDKKRSAGNADGGSYPASLLVPARLSHARRALWPIGKIAAKTSSGNWVCKKRNRDFGRNLEQLSRTYVETHGQSVQHTWGLVRTAVVAFASTSVFSIKKYKTSAVSTTESLLGTQLCKLRGTSDICFIFDMLFVNLYLIVNTLLQVFHGRSFARVQQSGSCHARRILVAQCMRPQAFSMCVCEKLDQISIFFPRLINCFRSCRKLHADQRVSTGVLVPRRRWKAGAHCCIFSNLKSPRTARKSRRC